MSHKVTDKTVKAMAPPSSGNRITYDSEVKGFGVRITAAGSRSFVLNYRRKADGLERRWTIGSFPDWGAGAAREEAQRLKRLVDGGADPVGAHRGEREAPTVADLCDRFIEEYLPRKRDSTRKSYGRLIAVNIRPPLGRLKVANVDYREVDALHRSISKRTPYEANRTLAVLSRMFSVAIRWKWRTDNPCKGIERNDEAKRRRYSHPGRVAAAHQGVCGAPRPGGGGHLPAVAVDRRKEGGSSFREVGAIRSENRHMDQAGGDYQAAHRAHRAAVGTGSPVARQSEADFGIRFPRHAGGHRVEVKESWAAICKVAGIANLRMHDLRHSYASHLASAGVGLHTIGALLGHTQPSTTHRYAHLMDDPLRTATERVGAILSGNPSAEIVPLKGAR